MNDKIEEIKKLADELYLDWATTHVHPKTCICCRTTIISPLYPLSEVPLHPLEQERGPWDEGIVSKINAGFGSRHDMESYYIAICDNCLTDLRDKKIIEVVRDIRKKIQGSDDIKNIVKNI